MKKYLEIFSRYLILILVAIPNLYLFYLIFTPLTLYLSYFALNLFFEATLKGNVIFIGTLPIEIIKSCVAGSAYYLLLGLNLTTLNIKIYKRIKMILISFSAFLAINIIRIFLLSILAMQNKSLFEIVHQVTWYFLSIGIVIGIWFAEVYFFKIKSIPLYSDIKELYK